MIVSDDCWTDADGQFGAGRGLTGIFGIFGTDVLIAGVQDILVHERGSRCNLSEEANLDWLADLDALALLYEYLPRVFASVFPVETRNPVLLGMVSFLERLQRSHEVMPSSDTRRDDSFSYACRDRTLDDCCHRVHGPDDLGLELRRNVELDLLEQVL